MADIYDSWGNTLSVQDGNGQEITSAEHIANLNPFRYRGYYFDSETGLYYLQNRYYDPQTCRFVNGDTTDILEAKGDLYDKNLFAYCDNNPVARVDYGGDIWHWLAGVAIGAGVGAIVSGTVSAISQYATTGEIDWGVVGVNAISGAISGAIAATNIGLGASIGVNAALGGGTYVAEQAVKGEKVTFEGVVVSTASGALSGLIGGKGADSKTLTKTWNSTAKSIERETRRANTKYATKQIAKYQTKKATIVKSIHTAALRFTLGSIGNTITRWLFGY